MSLLGKKGSASQRVNQPVTHLKMPALPPPLLYEAIIVRGDICPLVVTLKQPRATNAKRPHVKMIIFLPVP